MSNQANSVVISIAGSSGIREIAGIHQRILDALQAGGNTVIDLEHADDTDITLVQLIESARRYAAATGKVLALKQPAGPDLRTQLARGGFLSGGADRLFWLQSAETSQ
jgi:MFS superfamily sulfate permease-like transporter